MSEQLYRKIVTDDSWSVKTWSGYTNIYGHTVWSDGDNIYCFQGSGASHYIFNKITGEWDAKTWNNFSPSNSAAIWSDGNSIYYLANGSSYVLNKSTSTWEAKTWYDLNVPHNPNAMHIWSDGNNIYYSDGSYIQYVLNKATSTWSVKTWDGFSNIKGEYVWSDGDNIYYSYDSDQYIYDKATGTWSSYTWNGFTPTYSTYIWSDGDTIYYSDGTNHYMLNKETNTWSAKTWNVLTSFDGSMIWSDGENVYYSYGNNQYVLDKIIEYEPVTIPISMKVKDRGGIWYPVKGISVRTHGGSEATAVKLDTKVPCLTANGDVVIMYDSDGNILAHKSDIGNVAALTRFAMYEIRNIYTGETCPFDTSDVSAEQVSSIYVDGEGYLAYNDADDTEGENPYQMLEWSSLNEATIDFASIAGYPRYS